MTQHDTSGDTLYSSNGLSPWTHDTWHTATPCPNLVLIKQPQDSKCFLPLLGQQSTKPRTQNWAASITSMVELGHELIQTQNPGFQYTRQFFSLNCLRHEHGHLISSTFIGSKGSTAGYHFFFAPDTGLEKQSPMVDGVKPLHTAT